jgi:hypothetical protein
MSIHSYEYLHMIGGLLDGKIIVAKSKNVYVLRTKGEEDPSVLFTHFYWWNDREYTDPATGNWLREFEHTNTIVDME